MSKLLKRLDQISEGAAQPIGFGITSQRSKVAPMIVIASVPSGSTRLVNAAVNAGADFVLLTVEHQKKDDFLNNTDSMDIAVPWGVSLDTLTREDTKQLIKKKCDFVVFGPAKAEAAVMNEDDICKVLRIDTSLSDDLAIALNRLPINAVLIDSISDNNLPLTIHQLMHCERLVIRTGKHPIVTIPLGVPVSDIEALWSLGVLGVAIDLAVKGQEQRLSQVKEAVCHLPSNRKRPKERIRAKLPMAGSLLSDIPVEEEEEEDI